MQRRRRPKAALRLPFSFTAGAPYAPSERLVCSLNVWDCANVSWSDLDAVLLQHEIGVLGMKSLGDPFILESQTVTPIECPHDCETGLHAFCAVLFHASLPSGRGAQGQSGTNLARPTQ